MSTINVVIETPKGSAQKYDLDPKTGYFKLNKMMPSGLVFPYDFGFITGTIGEDGDPLDAIVISEIKSFPGCAIDCKVIGAIKATQRERDGEKVRNDRYICVPEVSKTFEKVANLKDFPKKVLGEIENFFVNYNQQAGKKFKPLKRINAKKASAMLQKAKKNADIHTKLIQLFLPLTDGDGNTISNRFYVDVKQKLTTKFKGLSIYENRPVDGRWKDESDSQVIKDRLLVFEVMSSEIDTSFWEKYKAELEEELKQESIVIRSLQISVI